MINILYLTSFGKVTKEEKESINLKETVLDIVYLIRKVNIQIHYLLDIIKMGVRY